MAGVFQVDREIFDNSIWQNPAEFRLFFYILGNAVWNEEGVKYGDVLVKRGQYLRSYRNLRIDLMYMDNNTVKYYGIATIKRNVDKLVIDGRLKKEETELGTLFTVVNYNKYQGFERFDNDSLEQQRNTCGTPAEHLRNNKKKDNKDNKKNPPLKKEKRIFTNDDKEYLLSKYLSRQIAKRLEKPEKDEKTLQSWSDVFNKMVRLDKLDIDEMKDVLVFSQGHKFWKNNILSAGKFRTQYLTLLGQMKGEED